MEAKLGNDVIEKNGILIPKTTVFNNLKNRNSGRFGDTAIEMYGYKISFEQLINEADTYIKSFEQLGIKEGDVVTLCMPAIPEFIIAYYALNKMGAIANGISITFLAQNLEKYTTNKNSSTLVLFEGFLPLIREQIKDGNVQNIIITNSQPYSEKKSDQSGDILSSVKNERKTNFIRMNEFIRSGKNDLRTPHEAEYDSKRESTYLYTSGTTGEPKCVVFNDDAINALVSMHDPIESFDHVNPGDRSLLIIPPYYTTSLLYAVNLQLANGRTLVLQPKYDKRTFAHDLRDLNINHTVAAASHYSTLVNSDLKTGDLSKLKFPGCGGEGVPYGLILQINDALKKFGCKEDLFIGGGTSELGSCVIGSYNIANRLNATGKPLPGVDIKLIDPSTGKEITKDGRGEMILSAPSLMTRYYGDHENTKEYFTTENGKRWAHPGDIVEKKEGIFRMLGRKSDSYLDGNQIRYLFDIEDRVSHILSIAECEAIALDVENGNKKCPVLYVVLNPECIERKDEIMDKIYEIVSVDGVKFVSDFATSPITGKRDTTSLKKIRDGFFAKENNEFYKRDFPIDSDVVSSKIDRIDCKNNVHVLK